MPPDVFQPPGQGTPLRKRSPSRSRLRRGWWSWRCEKNGGDVVARLSITNNEGHAARQLILEITDRHT